MKKRILSALLAIMICIVSIGAVSVSAETGDLILSDTTTVNVENTDTCFAKPTNSEYHVDSNYYMHFKSTGDWLEVTQNLVEGVTAGSQYIITVVAKPVSGTVWFRVGWDDAGWLMSGQTELATELGDGWIKYEKTITMTTAQSSVLFHNDGAAEIYIDSISLKPVDEEKELLPNGGFDYVTYDSANDTITANETTVNLANTENYFVEIIGEGIPSEYEYSLHFKAGAGDWLEVSQNLTDTAKAGSQYVLTAYVKPVTGNVWFYVDWDATGWMATHAAKVIAPQPDGWTLIQKTITMTEDKAKLLFHNDSETEMYIDDISLVAVGGTENLIPDGGFDEVTVVGGEQPPVEPEEPTVDIPDEELTLSATTRISANAENCYAKVTDNEKNGGNYSLHFYTEGDWIEIAQDYTQALAAGDYILTWYAKGSGTVWFYSNWGTEFATTQAVDSAEPQANGWTKYTRTLHIDGDGDTSFLFHGDGAVDQYIDDISLVDANGVNYIIDGGFEEVTVIGGEEPTPTPTPDPEEPEEPSVDIPDENLTLSETTHQNQANTDTCFIKVTDNDKASGSYSLHFKATAGDWFEIDQTLLETAKAGGQYVISAAVKPVTGRVWFRLGWDDNGWMVADTASTGTDLGNGWIKVVKEVTLAGDEGDIPKLLFHNDGEVEMYIDDISIKAVGSDIELMPDGGFEEVTIAGGGGGGAPSVTPTPTPTPDPEEPEEPSVDIPDEYLTLSETTHQNQANTETCFIKVTDDDKASGKYSLHFKATAADWFEIDQTLTENIVAGGNYIISASVKPISGQLWFRLGWDDAGWMVANTTSEGTDLGNGWIRVTKEVTLAADQTKLLFHNDGETEAYIDDISVKAVDGDVELMPDGGFEEVTVNEPVVDIPDEKLVLSDKTTVNVENTDDVFAKVTDDDKGEGSYAMHFKSGADHLEVSQRLAETVVAGGTYVISADVRVVSGQLWFRLGWDDNGWMAASAPLTRSVLPAGWTHIEKEVTLAADQTTVLFHNSGETEAYIDNLSVKAVGSDTELVPDGGFEDVIIACDEHTWDEGVETTAPTCTQDGVKTYTCTVCGLTYTETIPATGHSYDEGVVTQEPTVDEEGVKTYTCTVCGGTYTEAIEKLPAPSVAIGDANEDGAVDVGDVTSMRQDIAGGYGVVVNKTAADVNKDGAFDVGDVTHLRQFIAGGYGIEL